MINRSQSSGRRWGVNGKGDTRNTQATKGSIMGRGLSWGPIYSLKQGEISPVAIGTHQKGEERGTSQAVSFQPVALLPPPEPFYTWGLRQLWSKVDPLKQLGAHVWPQLTLRTAPQVCEQAAANGPRLAVSRWTPGVVEGHFPVTD